MLSVDCPPELRELGAGQTSDQLKIFGDFAKWFFEVGTHEASSERVRWMRTLACRAWWTALEFDAAPKIIARLPFVERADHPAALPVFVVSRAAADAMVTEVEVWSVRVAGWGAGPARALAPLAEVIAVQDRAFDGAALLVSVPQGGSFAGIADALVKAGASVRSAALVGSHATRYTVPPA